MRLIILFLCVAFLPNAIAHSYHSDYPKRVYFITPSDGTTVTNPVKIKFGATGVNIVPAGVDMPDSGHHHLLINVPLPDLTRPIPSDENHIHYGKGQTSDTIELPKGVHKLRLVLGNFAHIPHEDPIISDELIIEVR